MTGYKASVDALLLRAFACSLFFYPRSFREAHGESMLQSVRDALTHKPRPRISLCRLLLIDLIQSCARERFAMLPRMLEEHPIAAHAVGLGLILSFLGGAGMVTMQQLLRRGADQPQVQMVEHAASRLAAGEVADQVIPASHIEMGHDLEPFLVYYDDQGNPLKGTGYLNRVLCSPPHGVFDSLRTHRDATFTWQPQRSVRIAAVMRRVEGPHAGFLLAGRNMVLVEKQESLLYRLCFAGWLSVVLLLALGAAMLSRHHEKQSAAAAR